MTAAPSPSSPRSVTILGATGSVGASTLAVMAEDPASYRVEAVTGHRRPEALAQLARACGARFAAIGDPAHYISLRDALADTDIEVAAGEAALVEAAARPADWVMAAIVGAAGLAPTLAAVERGATVALANKECLVCAGDLFMRRVKACGARLLPVDSEHNAIFQCLTRNSRAHIERLVLTASGGPFRLLPFEAMASVTPEQAAKHPRWSMGAKISVDSATMMNKGLEVIEAHALFGVPEERIDVLIHPQSIVHSMVTFTDGSVLAQLGEPDMRIPIAYALGWPERLRTQVARLDLARAGPLEFAAPDARQFPALGVARQALRRGRGAPTILNAANEVAVAAFIARRIGFLDIVAVVEDTLADAVPSDIQSIGDAIALDVEARHHAQRRVRQREAGWRAGMNGAAE